MATPYTGRSQPVLISALQHYSYCPRQCALIHVEQTFNENLYTLRGRAVHERVDQPAGMIEDGVQVERGLPLWSECLGLIGKSDVVEFRDDTPYPVEYKHGPRRRRQHDDIQLCAQALCLEEMFGKPVPAGAIFHHSSKRRREVLFDAKLKSRVVETAARVRELFAQPRLPPAVNDGRCDDCSLLDSCVPSAVTERRRLHGLLGSLFEVADP